FGRSAAALFGLRQRPTGGGRQFNSHFRLVRHGMGSFARLPLIYAAVAIQQGYAMPPSSPRAAAIHLLDQILGEHRPLSDLLATGALDHLSPPDRARAQRLTIQTLRGMER